MYIRPVEYACLGTTKKSPIILIYTLSQSIMSRKSSLCHCLLTRIRKRANKSNKLPSRSHCEDLDSPAGYIVQAITDAHASLAPLIELTPGEPINSILSRLVGICCEIHPSEVIAKVILLHQLGDPVAQHVLTSSRNVGSVK